MPETHELSVTDASNTTRFPENQAPSTVNNGARALEGMLARFFSDLQGPNLPVATLSGSVIQFTANRTSITLTGTTSNYVANLLVGWVQGSNPSIDGVSLRINDIQTLSLRDNRGQTLSSSFIPAGSVNFAIKDGTNNYFRHLIGSNHTFINPTIIGTATNDAAATGAVGQLIESEILVGSAVSLTNTVDANITSISLTAGDWDVRATIALTLNAATTFSYLESSISTTSATHATRPGNGASVLYQPTHPTGNGVVMPVGTRRLSLAATTTVYLVAGAGFGVNTCAAYGYLGARRVR